MISRDARGLSRREIQGHLDEISGAEVSPPLLRTIPDPVAALATEGPSRPVDAMDPVGFFDAIRGKVGADGLVRNKAVHVALGVTLEGRKAVLG